MTLLSPCCDVFWSTGLDSLILFSLSYIGENMTYKSFPLDVVWAGVVLCLVFVPSGSSLL